MFRLAWTPLTLVTQTSTLDKGETGMGITFKGKKKKKTTVPRHWPRIPHPRPGTRLEGPLRTEDLGEYSPPAPAPAPSALLRGFNQPIPFSLCKLRGHLMRKIRVKQSELF